MKFNWASEPATGILRIRVYRLGLNTVCAQRVMRFTLLQLLNCNQIDLFIHHIFYSSKKKDEESCAEVE
jgi:hypothetical protein